VPRRPYTTLSREEIAEQFSAIARDAESVFGHYSALQLNWRPGPATWSIAQCFDHLLKADHEMSRAIDRALDRRAPRTVWQRLPLWPRLFGWMLITSQSPGGKQKYTAPASAQPAASNVDPHSVERFIAWQHTAIGVLRALSAEDTGRIMVSPFVSRITYSVLDGYRLIAAHQRRHFEQAERVAQHSEFPASKGAVEGGT
jgi:DinB family protein